MPPPSTEAGTEPSAPDPSAPERLELEIERLAPGGDGVARDASGRVVFVPFAAPGDRVRVEVTETHARFARARVETLLSPGPERTEPACDAFGACGGCTWQHVRYPAQLAAKAAFIEDALRRIAHLEAPGPIEVEPSPVEYGYRIRTRIRVEGGRVGYHRRRSRAFEPVRQCPILAPELATALAELPERARGRDGDWWLALSSDGSVHAAPAGRPPPWHRGRRRAPPRVRLSLAGFELECALGGFHQANGALFETLAGAVLEAAGRGATAVELFAGAGYLTLGLSERFDRVIAVEGDRRAVRDLERNCRKARAERIEVVSAGVELALREAPVASAAPDVVVLDPPRTGLPPSCPAPLAALGAEKLVYLSCDAATFARDAAALVAGGYRLVSVRGFDLFPQTPNVELLGVFARSA